MPEFYAGKNLNEVFVITGRAAFDDDDTISFIEAPSLADAKVIFKKNLAVNLLDRLDDDQLKDPDELEGVKRDIYINSANSLANYLKEPMMTAKHVEEVDLEFEENNFTATPAWGESGEEA